MDIKKTAMVTALFDIGRENWDNFTMSYHTYCWWMRSLLYLDTNLIIYTEERFKNDILNYRREVDPELKKTILVLQPLSSIEGYKIFYEPLKNLMESDDFKKKIQFDVPEMNKPLYNVVMFAKLFYILDSYKKNLFDADLYVWADAGVIRKDRPDMNVKWPDIQKINLLDNNKVTFFCHHDYVGVGPSENEKMFHAFSQTRFIQGGAFFVPKKCVEEISSKFEEISLDVISKGYVGSDEKIFDFVYTLNPEKYNLIKCGWREYIDLFTNNGDLEIVVAKYNEDTSWTENLKYKSIIYNKNKNDVDLFEHNLPNVGREGHTFFYHIVENYDNLSEYTAFLQGNPFDHDRDFLNKINNFNFKTEFLEIGNLHELTMMYDGINQQVESYSKGIGFEIMYPIYMIPGGQYIISRRLIRKKPKEFYKKILDSLSGEVYPQQGLDVEKTLLQLYGIYKP